jgi:hypothetical protein
MPMSIHMEEEEENPRETNTLEVYACEVTF